MYRVYVCVCRCHSVCSWSSVTGCWRVALKSGWHDTSRRHRVTVLQSQSHMIRSHGWQRLAAAVTWWATSAISPASDTLLTHSKPLSHGSVHLVHVTHSTFRVPTDLKSQENSDLETSGVMEYLAVSLEIRKNIGPLITDLKSNDITVLLWYSGSWRIKQSLTSCPNYFTAWWWIGVAEREEEMTTFFYRILSLMFTECHIC